MFATQFKSELESHLQKYSGQLKVKLVIAEECKCLGDVMRSIHARELIKDDFVLLTIDTVTNMDIQDAVAFHFQKKNETKN